LGQTLSLSLKHPDWTQNLERELVLISDSSVPLMASANTSSVATEADRLLAQFKQLNLAGFPPRPAPPTSVPSRSAPPPPVRKAPPPPQPNQSQLLLVSLDDGDSTSTSASPSPPPLAMAPRSAPPVSEPLRYDPLAEADKLWQMPRVQSPASMSPSSPPPRCPPPGSPSPSPSPPTAAPPPLPWAVAPPVPARRNLPK
jgi:hypothetical protein